ncbi:hypothetical protein [Massilia alkalitolerans]|uniref:hypothetical protein n=1 Tax=Massilia alkalitolerans TaxID=286638 RepID=UPI0012EC72EE|nr:hypothetical protein [Massilia alkalitolerans]
MFLGVIVIGCVYSTLPQPALKPAAAETTLPAPAKKIAPPERKAIIAAATKSLKGKYDKFANADFYQADSNTLTSSRLKAYIAVPAEGPAALRFSPIYYGSRWVLFKHVKIVADGSLVFDRPIGREHITRDNDGGHVWEVADLRAEADEQRMLSKVATAKSVTIRFIGRDRTHDHELTTRERANLKQVLSAFSALESL